MDFITQIYAALLPTLLQFTGLALAWIIARVATVAKDRWGIEIEAKHREALHSALMSGIRAALSKGLSGQEAVAAAIAYAQDSVPDAMERLGPSIQVLSSLAEAKLREATEGK